MLNTADCSSLHSFCNLILFWGFFFSLFWCLQTWCHMSLSVQPHQWTSNHTHTHTRCITQRPLSFYMTSACLLTGSSWFVVSLVFCPPCFPATSSFKKGEREREHLQAAQRGQATVGIPLEEEWEGGELWGGALVFLVLCCLTTFLLLLF